ncbi:MAG: helix-turn-helix transcriptional regulator [Phycisphaerae bacterium]|jgi:transcriptional regulator with XRE-family HTH domain
MMEEKGIKAADIVRSTGISKGAISKYLSVSNKEPLGKFVLIIAKYFNVSPEWLYGLSDIKKSFHDKPIIPVYEELSEEGKREVERYAEFIKGKEDNRE